MSGLFVASPWLSRAYGENGIYPEEDLMTHVQERAVSPGFAGLASELAVDLADHAARPCKGLKAAGTLR